MPQRHGTKCQTTTHEAAVEYARLLGFSIFPVGSDCRTPLVEHGVHDATKDPEQITALWARNPYANLAVACGERSGILVIDLDKKDGKDGFAAFRRLRNGREIPRMPWSSTPSGGAHLFFRFPEGVCIRNRVNLAVWSPSGEKQAFEGVDVRSNGGSVALAPSRRADGAYKWEVDPFGHELPPCPAWLLEAITSEPPRPKQPPLRFPSTDRAAHYVAAAVNNECSALASMKPGSGRNLKLFQAAANLGSLIGAGLLPQGMAEAALEQAADACGLWREDGPHACGATIRSGMQRGLATPREISW